MDLIHLMTVFIAVGEEECLATAARRLDLSTVAVKRAVGVLESHLHVPLLLRMSRTVLLTEAGRRYLQSAKRIMAALTAADQEAHGANLAYRGRLSVTAPFEFGRLFVLPCIADYMHRNPGLDIATCFVDRVVNLVDEGYDVAVRIGPQPNSGLKCVPVGRMRHVLCASPVYLARQGVPKRPADLRRHMLIAHSGLPRPGNTASQLHGEGPCARLTLPNSASAAQAAVAGLGIATLMMYQVASQVADGSLEIVLAGHEGAALPVQVLHRQGRYGASKVRNFIDLLVASLRAERRLA